MNLRSHNKYQIIEALRLEIPVWKLDTDTDGDDDVILGEYEECLADICYHHGIDLLPEDWKLTRITNFGDLA